jgi:hypothetical protein
MSYFWGLLQAGLSRFRFGGKEESPDSSEQCTGEEPGIPLLYPVYNSGVTDSATENYRSLFLRPATAGNETRQ